MLLPQVRLNKAFWLLPFGLLLVFVGLFVLDGAEKQALDTPQPLRGTFSKDSFLGSDPKKGSDPDSPSGDAVTLVAVGDIMLSRTVAAKMRQYGDYTYPFLKTGEVLSGADITFGNLETAITPGREIRPLEMVFRADPEAVTGLTYAGFDILSLANNHTPNFGQEGLQDTFHYLKEAGMEYVGAGENEKEAYQPVFLTRQGLTFAFLAYNDADVVPASYFADQKRAGTARMNLEAMRRAVQQAKTQAHHVVVSIHSGNEYQPTPNTRQQEFARAAIDAGAILVLGHHPHVVQTAEAYSGGYIFYSLGNFVFDQMWSMATRRGLVVRVTFDREGMAEVEYFPVVIEDYCQPRWANSEESQAILTHLGEGFAHSRSGLRL